MIEIETEGLKEFRQELEKLGADFKTALKSGIMKGARKVAKDGNANAKARGFTMGKYYSTSETKSTRKSDTSITVLVGTKRTVRGAAPKKNKIAYYKEQGDFFYIKFPEFGTIHQAPQPTLQPALESNREYVNKCIAESFNKAVEKAGG